MNDFILLYFTLKVLYANSVYPEMTPYIVVYELALIYLVSYIPKRDFQYYEG